MTTKSAPPVPLGIPLLLGVISISFAAILIKWATAPAGIIGFYRLVFTVILFLPFAWRLRRHLRILNKRAWILLTLSGIFLGLHFLFWIESLKLTSVASSMTITALQPIFVMIGAFFIFGERIRLGAQMSILVSLVGISIITGMDIHLSVRALIGDLLSCAGTVAISVYMISGQNLRKQVHSLLYSTIVFAIASIVLGVYDFCRHISFIDYPSRDWFIFLVLAVIPTIMGHALFNWLLRYVSATIISVNVLGEPVGAIILAWLLLHQPIGLVPALGVAVTLLGVWLFLRFHKTHE